MSANHFYAPPNEDFGRRNKRWVPDFRMDFQLFVAQIENTRPWNGFRKVAFIFCSSFQNLRLGSIKWKFHNEMSMSTNARPFNTTGTHDLQHDWYMCFYRNNHHAIIILWVYRRIVMLIIWCYHHLVTSTDTSPWIPQWGPHRDVD